MLKPTTELERYISLVSLNFMNQTYYSNNIVSVECERQENIRTAIISLLKLYKGIPLDIEEQELLNKYPLENDYKTELESCIAFIAYKISKESWNIVNNIQMKTFEYEQQYDISTLTMFDPSVYSAYNCSGCVYFRDTRPSEIYQGYLEFLNEYNSNLLNAWASHSEIRLITPNDRKWITPKMDFDGECFKEYTPMIKSLIRKFTKKQR